MNTVGNSPTVHNVSDRILYPNLYNRIVEKYSTIQAFCRELGVQYCAVYFKLSGRRSIRLEEMETWAKLLEIPENEFSKYFVRKSK